MLLPLILALLLWKFLAQFLNVHLQCNILRHSRKAECCIHSWLIHALTFMLSPSFVSPNSSLARSLSFLLPKCGPNQTQCLKIIIYLRIRFIPSHHTLHLQFCSSSFSSTLFFFVLFTHVHHHCCCCFSFVSKSHLCFIFETIHQNSIRRVVQLFTHVRSNVNENNSFMFGNTFEHTTVSHSISKIRHKEIIIIFAGPTLHDFTKFDNFPFLLCHAYLNSIHLLRKCTHFWWVNQNISINKRMEKHYKWKFYILIKKLKAKTRLA